VINAAARSEKTATEVLGVSLDKPQIAPNILDRSQLDVSRLNIWFTSGH
jgi:hypothetical protein